MNGVLLQFFHWYSPNDGNLWNELSEKAESLNHIGINAVWLPPCYKGNDGANSIGYDTYDLFDLGEFDQKGTIRTKYGTKEQLLAAIQALHNNQIQVYLDIVLNHKIGADEQEEVDLISYNPQNRQEKLGDAFHTKAYTKFTFPGRNQQYSNFVWDKNAFSGIDYDAGNDKMGIYKIVNEYGLDWENQVDDELGNYDYLLGNDIEFRNPNVVEQVNYWGKWLYEQLQFDGLRLDALKHIPSYFIKQWIAYVKQETKENTFFVGEYWSSSIDILQNYLAEQEYKIHLFDVPLHDHLHEASQSGNSYDLSQIFNGTLVESNPDNAVTIVGNHDTQPLQDLEAPVDPWFKPLAYALILMRKGGYPCVFYPDLYSATYTDKGNDGKEDVEIYMPKIDAIYPLLELRKNYAYGEQEDYLDHPNCIAWRRTGDEHHGDSVTIMTNSVDSFKEVAVGKENSGKIYYDFLKNVTEEITINEEGKGTFLAKAGSVSVWIQKK